MLTQEQYERIISIFPKNLNTAVKEAIKEKASIVYLKKGDTLLSQQRKNTNVYYILQGSFVRFIITSKGDEKAIMFHTESFMSIIGNSHIKNEKSTVTYLIKANENTEVLELDISIRDLAISDTFSIQFGSQYALNLFSTQNQIQNHLIGLSTEEFFEWLMKEYSFIFQRFQSKDIANFMGITPVWLSNIKRKQAKK